MLKERVSGVVSNMLNKFIDEEVSEWPPNCTFIMYQPERPETTTEDTD